MFTCNNCNKTFTSKFCTRLHERSHIGDDSSGSNRVGKYRCRHKGCKRTFEKLSSFVAHRSYHNSSLKYSNFKSMRTKIAQKKTQRCIDLKERMIKQMTGRQRKSVSGSADDGEHAQGHVRQGTGLPIKSTDNRYSDESQRGHVTHSRVKLSNPDISPYQRRGQAMAHNDCRECGPNYQNIDMRDNRQGYYHGTNSQAPINQIFVHQTFGTFNQMSQSSTNIQHGSCSCCDQKFGDSHTERGSPMKWVISGYGPVGCLYSCNKCQALFVTEEQLVDHQAVHELTRYDQDVGSIISLENFAKCYFADGSASLEQRRGHSLHCEECKLSFWREIDFERHLETNHAKYRVDNKGGSASLEQIRGHSLHCEECKMSFCREADYERHLETNHAKYMVDNKSGSASFEQRRGHSLHCEECKMSFCREADYERHLETNHAKYRVDNKGGSASFEQRRGHSLHCEECKMSFCREADYERHLETTHAKYRVDNKGGSASLEQRRGHSLHCEECKMSFCREADYERHLETNHAKYRVDNKRNTGLESGRNAVDVDIKIISAYSLPQGRSNVKQKSMPEADKNRVITKGGKQITSNGDRSEQAENTAVDSNSEQRFARKNSVTNRSIQFTMEDAQSKKPPDQGVSENVRKAKGAPVSDRCVICGEETGGSSTASFVDNDEREEGELPICESCNELVMEDDGDGDSSNESLAAGNLSAADGSDDERLDFSGDYTRLRIVGPADAEGLSELHDEQSSVYPQDSEQHTTRSAAVEIDSNRTVVSSQKVLQQGQNSVSSSASVRMGYFEGDQGADVARNNTVASPAGALPIVTRGEQTTLAKTEGEGFGEHTKADEKRRKRKNRPKESSHRKKKIKKEYDESTLSWEPRRMGYKSRHSLKLFTCVVCHHSFTRDWNLKNHMRTHTGERPFTCEYCNRTFVMKHHLKRHLGTKEGGGCKATLGYRGAGYSGFLKQETLS